MKTEEAIAICESWFDYIERGRQRSIELQKLAAMARSGQQEEAQRRLRQIDRDTAVTVYDGSRLEPAVRHLVKLASSAEKEMVSEVKTIYEVNARQIVEQLRQCANNIEAGKCAFEIRGAVLILAGRARDVDVYSWGELDNFSTLGVIARGAQRVHEVIDGVSP